MSTRSRKFLGAAILGVAALLPPGAAPAIAAREPVLKQIKLPHAYYYREMYLPQVTSGPGAAAWSPDGRELAVAMAGSLWRLRPETGVATQITDGPGYDHQPDWSPDGRFIAYTSYRDDAVEIRLLDLQSGASRPLVSNGAVNIEPRFSPDGRRIAFVSTVFNQRFHVHLVDLGPDGAPGDPVRLTEDHDSGLPRYYYSPFDHYLSPSWSPDGEELILVSNRDRIWGTGGIWRAAARPGARLREIRPEETSWRARPDWSPDGRRIVYASYLGRPWHQLWLVTAEGGDPFPITYGEFDATSPRWSPDGRRIAFISNETGNTSLVIMEIPGGRQERVAIRERRYRAPVGLLRIEVLDAGGRPLPARLSVTGPDGRSFAPDEAWRHADDAFDRAGRKFEYAYFHSTGRSALTVPAGAITVEAIRGLEYGVERRVVTVPAGGAATVRFPLRRIADLPARGWWGGDLHVHMNYGGAYRHTPKSLAFQARAEDLHVVENVVVNKEQRIPDLAYFSGRPDPVSTPGLLIAHGQEYHTSFWGHSALLGLQEYFVLPAYAAYANTPAASLQPANAAIFDLAHDQKAITGYVHPFDARPDPGNADQPFSRGDPIELPVDVALGKVDYLEVVGFSDHLITAEIWYRLLNCGFRIPAGGGTDAMANFASLRGPVGLCRTYVKTGPSLDRRAWLEGIRTGRTFATNGPLLEFRLGGKEPGGELTLGPGRHRVEVRARLRSIVPVDHFEIVGNGRVVADLPLTGGRTSADYSGSIDVEGSGWYTLRAWAGKATHPILDLYPFGTTSPIYVTAGGAPIRSAEDARYFLTWIDRLFPKVESHTEWYGPGEKTAVLDLLRQARDIFEARGGEPRADD